MKVLLVVTWYNNYNQSSATGVFHYEQALYLSKHCDVALYYPFDQLLDKSFYCDDEKGVKTYRTRGVGGRLKRQISILRGFAKVVKDFKPDVIHAQVASQAGFYSIIIGKLYRIPVIITEHNPIELMSLESKKNYAINRFAYHNSKANICVSNDSRDRLSVLFPKESFQTIYNGIVNPVGLINKTNYRVPNKTNLAIVAAFYSKDIKGYQFLLPAIKMVKDDGFDVVLHIVGGGDYEEYYRNMASDLGIQDNCIFYSHCERSKVYTIMSQMDFVVSASIFECSGVSVQEAMLLGKPLVVTKSGGANSLVTEKTAIVVERNSVEKLAEGIKRMVLSYNGYNEKEIHDYAFKNFEISQVNSKYLALYSSISRKKQK